MKPSTPLQLRPCIITALELIGLDKPAAPKSRLRRIFTQLKEPFAESDLPGRSLLVVGPRILRASPLGLHTSILFNQLLDLVHIQADLLEWGVLAKGAVTLGEALVDSSLATGPGVSEAVRLCDEIAEVPRVIVDPRLLREVESNPELRSDHHTVPQELGFIRSLLREDADGIWFLDYLRAIGEELDAPSTYPDLLESHREIVSGRLEAAMTLDRPSRAWIWLSNYHNKVIKECFDEKILDDEERKRLRLRARSPLLFAFPSSAKPPT